MPMKNNLPDTIEETSLSTEVVIEYLTNPGSVEISKIQLDPAVASAQIKARMLRMDSAEELFTEERPKALKARDNLSKPFMVSAITFLPSDFDEEGLPFFGVIEVTDVAGVTDMLTCGAENVVLKLAIADSRGWLPRWLKFVELPKTAAGFHPLDVVAAPEPSKPVEGSNSQADF